MSRLAQRAVSVKAQLELFMANINVVGVRVACSKSGVQGHGNGTDQNAQSKCVVQSCHRSLLSDAVRGDRDELHSS